MPASSSRYPKWVQCRHEFAVEIRPLRTDQIGKHMDFLHALDERDLMKLPCDVKDEEYPQTLREQIAGKQVKRIVAWYGINEIVGSLVLYPGTSRWVAHTGTVVMVTHPDYRRFGVATVLCDEVVPLARELGIRKIYAHLSDFHKEAINMMRSLGFRREATLDEHVLDEEGELHPMHIYGMKLSDLEKAMVMRMAEYIRLEHKA